MLSRDDILRMAREAHRRLVTEDYPGHTGQLDPWTIRLLERFANLVAAAERDHMIADGWRQCAKGQRTSQFCDMVEQEREACARVCAEYDDDGGAGEAWAGRFAAAIRARGQQQEPEDGNPSF